MNETEIYNIKRLRLQQTVEEINMKKITQKDRVLQHLRDYGSITTWESFQDYGITRLSAVIFDLIHKFGIPIDGSERVSKKNRYGEKVSCTKYKLVEVNND